MIEIIHVDSQAEVKCQDITNTVDGLFSVFAFTKQRCLWTLRHAWSTCVAPEFSGELEFPDQQ